MRAVYERPFGKNAITFSDVVKQLRTTFETFTDRRTGKNTNYTIRMADHRLLLALDGTQYFSSQKLHGQCCSCKTHSNSKVSYSHMVVTPVLVKPGSDKAISLAPEFIRPQDGHEKQDCEINASLRWLESRGSHTCLLCWLRSSCSPTCYLRC